MKMNRRKFIYGSAVATAALSARSWGQVARANSDVRVAVVGFRGRGGDHIKGFRDAPGSRVVALCDADQEVLGKEMSKDGSATATAYTDIRKLLENKDVDVISIATPNHWHALGAIWSIQAGKDVYIEKPVSHNVWEGRKIVEAARKYGKIVQTGTQSRSNPGLRDGVKFIQDGHLGKIKLVRGLCYKRRASIGKVTAPQPVPANVDYDLWCGPAPLEPLMRQNLHYDWHWVWSTGNGDLGNQGIHQMDIARWILGVGHLSPLVLSVGGRVGYVDDGQTPNTQIVYHEYSPAPLIFEVRGLPASRDNDKQMDKYRGASVGVVAHCEGGHVVFPSYDSALVYDLEGNQTKKFQGGANHYQNFLDAVRSRKHQDLNADILEGHLSSALCHTGNISYRLGAAASPEKMADAIQAHPDLAEAFGRMREHLAAHEIHFHQTPLYLGQTLRMDPQTERFIGHEAANRLLTREYRKPYVVPETV